RLRLVRAPGRGAGRCDLGGQPPAVAAGVVQRVLPRWLRLRGRSAGGACGGRARSGPLPAGGAVEQRAGGGDGGNAGRDPVARGWGDGAAADHAAGRGGGGAGTSAVGGAVRTAIGGGVP